MEVPLKIVIVEDEPVSNAYLKKLLGETGISTTVVGELNSVSSSILFFSENNEYDLVFMDIHLGDGNCFALLNAKVIKKPIIFCTTFDNYAIQAFKYNSIDYLLKPLVQDDVNSALKKFLITKNNEPNNYMERVDSLLNSMQLPKYSKRFLVKKDSFLELVETKDIVFFYSEGGQSVLVNAKGDKHLVEHTLERLEELTDPEVFFRINRKATINIDYIDTVEEYVNHRFKIEMKTNEELEFIVSRNRVKEFKIWLKGI